MNRNDIRNEIINKLTIVFREVFDDNSIILDDCVTADDIEGWDSLSHIVLISEIENAFGCKFTMKDLTDMKTTGDMAERILQLIS